MALRKVDRGAQLALVALLVLVDPRADSGAQPEFIGDARHQFSASRGGVGADRPRLGGDDLEIGANLRRRRPIAFIGVLSALIWGERNAGQRPGDIRRRYLFAGGGPQRRMHAYNKRNDTSSDAHPREPNGAELLGSDP